MSWQWRVEHSPVLETYT